jgi:hypothetical protein
MQAPGNHESDDAVNSGGARSAGPGADPNVTVGEEVGDVVADRPDDEDHDLLTFGEAGARLVEEVVKMERTIERLRAGGADDDVVERAERRLTTLRAARERNRAPSLDDLKQSGFFGGTS